MNIVICYTLFDIERTGIRNRNCPENVDNKLQWTQKRNSQLNFDTVLQAISMRSQPDLLEDPVKIQHVFSNVDKFGFLFNQLSEELYPCWKFSFTIQHSSVFNDGHDEFGLLYNDCHGIPMIHTGNEYNKLPNFLDCSDELRNIYFEVKNG